MGVIERTGKKSLATECRHLVYIHDKVSVSDGEGGHETQWNKREPAVWAAIYPIQARQRAEMQTYNVHATHHIKIRGRVDIEDGGTNRIQWGDRIFWVETVEDLQEREVVKFCTCREVRDVGTNL